MRKDRPFPVVPLSLWEEFTIMASVAAPAEAPPWAPWVGEPPRPPTKTVVRTADGLRSRALPWFGTRGERTLTEAWRAYANLLQAREHLRAAADLQDETARRAFAYVSMTVKEEG